MKCAIVRTTVGALGCSRSMLALLALSLALGCATGQSSKTLSDTERARMMVDIANGALKEGDATGALQHLVSAEKLDENLPELHHSKAVAFFMKQDRKTAILEARKALDLKPDYVDAQNTLGKLLLDEGNFAEAEKPLLSAANNPLYREAYKAQTNLGILYYRQGKDVESAAYLEKAIQEAPLASCIAYYYRGHLNLKSGRFNGAVDDYRNATKKACAGFADAHLALGIAYERNKQYNEARKVFLDIKMNFPNTKVAQQAMGRLKYLP